MRPTFAEINVELENILQHVQVVQSPESTVFVEPVHCLYDSQIAIELSFPTFQQAPKGPSRRSRSKMQKKSEG